MSKWIISLALFFVIILGGLFHQRHALACHSAALFEYQSIAPNVLVRQFDGEIVDLVNQARQRVVEHYGELLSSPKIVFADSAEEAQRFGSNNYGTIHSGPLGECVVLGPAGKNIDVAAHELMHAEVQVRTGWWQHWLQVPIWFNEGIALTVDHREPYLPQNIKLNEKQIAEVKQLRRDFFTKGDVTQNYQAARMAIAPVATNQLFQQLARIKQGESFSTVFSELH